MYPIRYEADYIEPQSRPKAFFRWILFIPWYILGSIYGLVAFVVAILAWFALLFTGRYPQGLYNFNAGFLRFTGRVYAFTFLQTEQWPAWGFDEEPGYQIRVEVDPPLESYNRWKVFFRLILGIPVLFMITLFQYLYFIAASIAWLHIVFMGRTSGGIHNSLTVGLAYQLRSIAYFLLVTETLPPISDQSPASTERGSAPKALSSGGATPAIVPPKAPAAKASAAKARAKPATGRKASAASKPAAKRSAAKPAAKSSAAKPKPAARKPAAKRSAAKPKPASTRRSSGGSS